MTSRIVRNQTELDAAIAAAPGEWIRVEGDTAGCVMTTPLVETSATPTVLWAVYDQPTQEIVHVFESRRDAQTWCDEHNNQDLFERYVLEPTDASEWGEDQVRWSQ